jgi:tetratricopeptide (TPR) repeat protein
VCSPPKLALLGLTILLLAGAPAQAQPGDLAEARQLFSEGVSHARAKQWELALAAFQAAYAIAPKPSVLFNLAAAQMRCGKLLASTANFRRFAASEDASITRSQRQAATLQIAHIETRIPRLRVQIEGLRDGDRVLLDQARVYPDELGHDMWLDPGVHTVRVDRPRGDQEVRTIAVTEGQVRVLAFRLP